MARWSAWCVAALAAMAFGDNAAMAQQAQPYVAGKTIEVVVGFPPAGSNDIYARAVTRHLAKHIRVRPVC